MARTISNELAFSAKSDNGKRKRRVLKGRLLNRSAEKKSKSPQIWATLMWHVNTGLPWDWRRGESGSSERQHLLEMIAELPPKSLLTADAGFAGYEVWKAILDGGHDLLIRVGGNTTLLKKLGYAKEDGNTVYLWPDRAAERSQPPLLLRLVVLKRGKKRIYFVTSILSRQVLSDQKLLGIAKLRWGVEVFFRSWKQTFDKRKLRSHKAEHALVELDWALIGLWGVCLLAQLKNRDLPPRKLSVAKVLRAVRRPMRSPASRPERGEDLFELLSRARIDDYRRRKPKASRDYPRKKQRDKNRSTDHQARHGATKKASQGRGKSDQIRRVKKGNGVRWHPAAGQGKIFDESWVSWISPRAQHYSNIKEARRRVARQLDTGSLSSIYYLTILLKFAFADSIEVN